MVGNASPGGNEFGVIFLSHVVDILLREVKIVKFEDRGWRLEGRKEVRFSSLIAMILSIDTTNFDTAHLSLRDKNGKIIKEKRFATGKELSKKLLLAIDKIVEGKPKNLKAIEVKSGPGSFTGIRIGVAVANALGYALGIPINGGKMAVPEYGREPNIT